MQRFLTAVIIANLCVSTLSAQSPTAPQPPRQSSPQSSPQSSTPAAPANSANVFETRLEEDGVVIVKFLDSTATDVVVPETIDGRPVVKIGARAFAVCKSLQSVVIPDGVKTIDKSAFYLCQSLQSVAISDGVETIAEDAFDDCDALTSFSVVPSKPRLKTVDGVLFTADGKTLIKFPPGQDATEYAVPNGVETIAKKAFEACETLRSIAFPASVETIDDSAFANCDSLRSVALPASLATIGESAFYDCDSLRSIALPASLATIGENAFMDCDSLESIAIPAGVKTIPQGAFMDCKSLESVSLPDGLETIGENAFMDCKSLESIVVPASVETIARGAFIHCKTLRSVNIENGVKTLGDGAFAFCESLESIVVPASVEKIAPGVFCYLPSLASFSLDPNNANFRFVDDVLFTTDGKTLIAFLGDAKLKYAIPNGVERIADYAFTRRSSLQSVSVPASVQEIGDAFVDCASLTSFSVAPNNPRFKAVDGVLFTADGKTLIQFPCGRETTTYAVPDGVETIENGAFYACGSLTSVKIPSSVQTVGESAFGGCESLTSVEIPDNVETIGEAAFDSRSADLTLYGAVGSVAEKYAAENGIRFEAR